MKKVKKLGIALILIGTVLVLIGVAVFVNKTLKAKQQEKDFMENTNLTIRGVRCAGDICTSELYIESTKGKGSDIRFRVNNRSDATLSSGEVTLVFDTGDKITYKYGMLSPKETVEVKKSLKNNLGYVSNYKLKKK